VVVLGVVYTMVYHMVLPYPKNYVVNHGNFFMVYHGIFLAGLAVGILLLSCIRAKKHVISYLLPVNGCHL